MALAYKVNTKLLLDLQDPVVSSLFFYIIHHPFMLPPKRLEVAIGKACKLTIRHGNTRTIYYGLSQECGEHEVIEG